MKNVPSMVLLGLLLAGCVLPVAFQQDELDQLTHTFEPLQLVPAYETLDWRYDIIRQETCETNSEGDSYTENVPYHPLGFDLGNGLFIDVSDNLALRIDQLLSHSGPSLTGLQMIRRRNDRRQDTTIFRNGKEAYCIESPNWLGRVNQTCVAQWLKGDTLTRFNGRRAQLISYQIYQPGKDLVYSRPNGRQFILEEEKPGRFQHIRKKGKREKVLDHYYLLGDEIHIGAYLLIRMSPDQQQIDVFYKRRKREVLAYSLRRNKETLYVIRPNQFGFTAHQQEGSVTFTNRFQHQILYEGIRD